MVNRGELIGESVDSNSEDDASLLSIFCSAAAYGSRVSAKTSEPFFDRGDGVVSDGNVEIGDGVNIMVNGLKDWSGRAD